MYLVPIRNKIKERRITANLSQHSLSLKAGLGGQAINRIERMETASIHPLRAKAIADALGCPLEEIFIRPDQQLRGGDMCK